MKVTRFEYDHATGVFTVQEFTGGEKCEYQTKDVWKVIQRMQNLVREVGNERHWRREG